MESKIQPKLKQLKQPKQPKQPKQLKNKPIEQNEPESCMVCMNIYTTVIRKKITCKYCKADTCAKCIERYLLDRHEDAHCLHCRVNYNDATLREICTKTYLQHTYFKHRQEVLINRERAVLPGLQDAATEEQKRRKNELKAAEIQKEINHINIEYYKLSTEYTQLYNEYYGRLADKKPTDVVREMIKDYITKIDELKAERDYKRDIIRRIWWPHEYGGANTAEGSAAGGNVEVEKKKFIRRCTRDGCQGFLSTAWKCGICEYYSCNKCFKTKTLRHDDPHECTKDDLETADLIRKDCKPCPNCGEFIMKSSGCSQMYCVSCQTPWDWNTGKVVTSGPIHNPHYYEWLQRNGGSTPRNPADVPCGGYPDAWQLVRMPRDLTRFIGDKFYEFHRVCQEIQDISTRKYRSHIDNTVLNEINIKFLLGDFDEKHWGQSLARHERIKKRDNEVQEIFAAYRMIAVELINRIQNFSNDTVRSFTHLPAGDATVLLQETYIEIDALIDMSNDALKNISISYNYSVPEIQYNGRSYQVSSKNFNTAKKREGVSQKESEVKTTHEDNKKQEEAELVDNELYDNHFIDSESVKTLSTVSTSSSVKRLRPKIAPSGDL